MPYKDKEKAKANHKRYMREVWYPKNRIKHIGYIKNLKLKLISYVNQYKKVRSCEDCGFHSKEYPEVLEFDHVRDKKFNISGASKFIVSLERLEVEMKKCELVCANCHRIRTVKRKGKT